MQHRKLCRVEEGERKAKTALARLQIELEEAQHNGTALPSPGPGVAPLVVSPSSLNPQLPTVTDAITAFLTYQTEEVAAETFDWYQEKLKPFYEQFGDRTVASMTLEDGTAYKKWLRTEKPEYRVFTLISSGAGRFVGQRPAQGVRPAGGTVKAGISRISYPAAVN